MNQVAINGEWKEHKTKEGRPYWYHSETKETTWEKPEQLKTPFEKMLALTDWKEYMSKDRRYWVNSVTKETTWNIPSEVKEIQDELEQATIEAARKLKESQSQLVKVGGVPVPNVSTTPQAQNHDDSESEDDQEALGPLVIPIGGFGSPYEAKEAFKNMLRRKGVKSDWTWEQTMPTIITDPIYKTYQTLQERRNVWNEYTANLMKEEDAEKKKKLDRLRPLFRDMLNKTAKIKSYSTWKTIRALYTDGPGRSEIPWKAAMNDEQRKFLFDEYIGEIRNTEAKALRQRRTESLEKLGNFFRSLDLQVTTKWLEVANHLLLSPEWQQDDELSQTDMLDVLGVFEDCMREVERIYDDRKAAENKTRRRSERRRRQGFIQLLQSLQKSGEIQAHTKWSEIYPLIKNESRYLDFLGTAGSTPIELFWDMVDDSDAQLDSLLNDVVRRLGPAAKEITDNMEIKQFHSLLHKCRVELNGDEVVPVFTMLKRQARLKAEDDAKRNETRLRERITDLRYAIRELKPPVDFNLSFEEAQPHFSHLKEFKALESNAEAQKAAWDKFVLRAKERMHEDEERSKRRRRDDDRHESRRRRGGSPRPDSPRSQVDSPRDFKNQSPVYSRKFQDDSAGRESRRDHISERSRAREPERERERERDRDTGRDRDRDRERRPSSRSDARIDDRGRPVRSRSRGDREQSDRESSRHERERPVKRSKHNVDDEPEEGEI